MAAYSPSKILANEWVRFTMLFLIVCALGVGALLAFRSRRGKSADLDGTECLIVNRLSNRCLTPRGGVAQPGVKVVQGPTPESAKSSEQWVLKKQSKPGYKVVHKDTGYVLEIAGANKERGGVAMLWTNSGDVSQQRWTFTPVDGAYALQAGHSGLYLAVAQGSTKDGGMVLQWDRIERQDDQLWLVLPLTR